MVVVSVKADRISTALRGLSPRSARCSSRLVLPSLLNTENANRKVKPQSRTHPLVNFSAPRGLSFSVSLSRSLPTPLPPLPLPAPPSSPSISVFLSLSLPGLPPPFPLPPLPLSLGSCSTLIVIVTTPLKSAGKTGHVTCLGVAVARW